jgi:hypothetical protein
MRNIVRFNAQRLSNSIKSGGFNIGVDNKSANLTGFFNGISPIIGGYVIYVNKASGGPSIYTPQNDTGLINITKSLGGNVSTVTESLVWLNSQSNMTVINGNYPPIVTDGLVLNLDAGLVSSYPKTGTTWRDLSGGANTTLVNGPTFSSDGGGSIVFDGINDNVNTNQTFNFNQTGQFSVEFFVNFNSHSDRQTAAADIIGKGHFYNNNWCIWLHNDHRITFETAGNPTRLGSQYLTTSVLNINTWYHFVATYNNGTKIIYLNGSQIGSSFYSGPGNFTNTNNVLIGQRPGDSSRSLRGSINSVRIYNRALTPQEVLQNYYSGLQRFIPTDGLILSLNAQNTNLYATSPTTIYDVSGNNNNGTMLNGVQYIGDAGGCWGFDGINDRCALLTNTTYGNNTTWAVWVNRTSSVNTLNMFMGRFLPYFAARSGTTGFHFSNTINSTQRNLFTTGITVQDNLWYHLTFTTQFDGTNTIMRIYVNGVLNNSGTFVGQQSQNSQPFNIGDGQNTTWFPFNGKINDVNVYNRTLTQTEITTIFNATRTKYGV